MLRKSASAKHVANLGAGAEAPQIPHFNTLPVLGKSQEPGL